MMLVSYLVGLLVFGVLVAAVDKWIVDGDYIDALTNSIVAPVLTTFCVIAGFVAVEHTMRLLKKLLDRE